VTPYAVSVHEAVELIATEDPQVAIVVVHNDDEHALALIGEAVEYASGPVIAQMPDADVDFLARAAEAGIAAYAESMDPESVQGAIEVAVRRYREAQRLSDKVEQLESALDRRGVIERAKGILMERHSVGERQAFELLRDHARASGRRVVDVAQSVLDGHALLPKQGN
jgi:response regulator NasT